MSTDSLFVYVTCPDGKVAESIGRTCVEARLAACANILPRMTSIYRWQDKVETASETVLILKTTQDNWPMLCKAVKASHPYDVPCIVALPIEDGHAPYVQWIKDSTHEPFWAE